MDGQSIKNYDKWCDSAKKLVDMKYVIFYKTSEELEKAGTHLFKEDNRQSLVRKIFLYCNGWNGKTIKTNIIHGWIMYITYYSGQYNPFNYLTNDERISFHETLNKNITEKRKYISMQYKCGNDNYININKKLYNINTCNKEIKPIIQVAIRSRRIKHIIKNGLHTLTRDKQKQG